MTTNTHELTDEQVKVECAKARGYQVVNIPKAEVVYAHRHRRGWDYDREISTLLYPSEVPDYTGSLDAAWQLVEDITSTDPCVFELWHDRRAGWIVWLGGDVLFGGTTPQRAICDAYLHWKRGKDE
jgi:hypothetical protein